MKFKSKHALMGLFVVVGSLAVFDFYKDYRQVQTKKAQADLIDLSIEQVDKIEILNSHGQLLLVRGIDGWKLTAPIEDIADNDVVEDYLNSMKDDSAIDELELNGDIDWEKYGLKSPESQLRLTTSGGKENTLQVSVIKNFEENLYARKNGDNKILVVNGVWHSRLQKLPIDFRERRVFRHKIASVDSFKIKFSREEYRLGRINGNWVWQNHLDTDLDQNSVREMLSDFSEAKGAEYLESLPAKTNHLMTLTVTRETKVTEIQVKQAEDFTIYAVVNDPKMILKLEPGALDYFIEFNINNLLKKENAPDKNAN